ncbi:hypothetical protein NM688_g6113 [Phlebia brevispora]|uniref:Uncharacterized protein n=1 Tax=Phlebia brevispora TaxID=194682 RepID=A0ACC1SJU9_9APHY|nr:hypothetical protein NM688_g6113 [Phlebia brevispora]
MPNDTEDTDIPGALGEAWNQWSAISERCRTVKFRRRHFQALLECYRDIIQRAADHIRKETVREALSIGTDVAIRLEQACEPIKALLDIVDEKGFLWSVMHAQKLNSDFEILENHLQDTNVWFHKLLHSSRIAQARHGDHKELIGILESSRDGDQLAKALQCQEPTTIRRTTKEIAVALRKRTQTFSATTEDSLPEDQFVQKASAILSHWFGIGDNFKLRPSVISRLEIDFDVHNPIGQGSFAIVHKGDWNGVCVAVKQMRTDRTHINSETQRKEFRHEVITWSTLKHPNILTFYGACLEAEIPFLFMEYCPFGHVKKYLESHPKADRGRLSRDVAAGLVYLHAEGIVHADIKPDNVLVKENHRACLTDFGLALKLSRLEAQSSYSEYMDQCQRGTRLYMAPEVHDGQSPQLESDVWSLALTIWQIYSGEMPFEKYLINGHLRDALLGAKDILRCPRQLINSSAWVVVKKCLEMDRMRRPTAKDVQNAFKMPDEQGTETPLHGLDPDMFEPTTEMLISSQELTVNNSSSATLMPMRVTNGGGMEDKQSGRPPAVPQGEPSHERNDATGNDRNALDSSFEHLLRKATDSDGVSLLHEVVSSSTVRPDSRTTNHRQHSSGNPSGSVTGSASKGASVSQPLKPTASRYSQPSSRKESQNERSTHASPSSAASRSDTTPAVQVVQTTSPTGQQPLRTVANPTRVQHSARNPSNSNGDGANGVGARQPATATAGVHASHHPQDLGTLAIPTERSAHSHSYVTDVQVPPSREHSRTPILPASHLFQEPVALATGPSPMTKEPHLTDRLHDRPRTERGVAQGFTESKDDEAAKARRTVKPSISTSVTPMAAPPASMPSSAIHDTIRAPPLVRAVKSEPRKASSRLPTSSTIPHSATPLNASQDPRLPVENTASRFAGSGYSESKRLRDLQERLEATNYDQV